MATETITLTERQRKPRERNLPPENERYLRACSDIASALVQEHEAHQDPTKPKRDVNLNTLRSKISKKHKLSNIPPLTAIIAAIPEHYKKYILPKLIAKPISMFLFEPLQALLSIIRKCIRDCCRCSHVQTPSLSSYCIHWKHLCVLSWWSGLRLRVLHPIIHWLRANLDASDSSAL
jgi:elongator complex protein 3